QAMSILISQDNRFLKSAGFTEDREGVRHLTALADIRDAALGTWEEPPPEAVHPHDRNPKFQFEYGIMLTWWVLGGELRVSRHPKTGKIQGPLARFFRAVTTPVMGPAAPSLESLPDIVRRGKEWIPGVESRALAFIDCVQTELDR